MRIELTIEGEVPDETEVRLGDYRVSVRSNQDEYFDVLNAQITTLRILDDEVVIEKPADGELE